MIKAKVVRVNIERIGEYSMFHEEQMKNLHHGCGKGAEALITAVGAEKLIGLIVKNNRTMRQFTTKSLSEEIDLSDATVNRIENGSKKLTLSDVAELEKVLKGLTKQLKETDLFKFIEK